MKRMMYGTMVIVMLMATIFVRAILAIFVNNNYTREGVIVATHAFNEEVIVVDTTGNEWRFYGVGYEVGDTVTMTMDKNNTDNSINDDIIKNVIVNTH